MQVKWIKDLNAMELQEELFNSNVRLYANNSLYKYCDEYVPFDTGTLSRDVIVTEEYVEYQQPYAHRIYNGIDFNFKKDKHPLATARWCDVSMEINKDKLARDINNYIKYKRG